MALIELKEYLENIKSESELESLNKRYTERVQRAKIRIKESAKIIFLASS